MAPHSDTSDNSLTPPTWTVMIYMAGDNNLTEECIYSLTEMKKADVTGNGLKVFAQYDPKDELLPVQRYEINKCGQPEGPLAEDLIDWVRANGEFHCESDNKKELERFSQEHKERPGEGFSGDPAALFNFVAYCLDNAPADRYALVICGHGAGIQRDYLLKDDSPEGYLTLKELKKVFDWIQEDYEGSDGQPLALDIFGMDVCLMSMAEIAYELRDKVKIAIGCASYGPASGWPYRKVLRAFRETPADAAAQSAIENGAPDPLIHISKAIVRAYANYYCDYSLGGLSVTQSAIDVRKIDHLKDGFRELAIALKEKLSEEFEKTRKAGDIEPPRGKFASALVLAHWDAQSYNGELYVDVVDFFRCLSARLKDVDSTFAHCCENFAEYVNTEIVIESCYHGRKFQWSYGLSIYFPWDLVVPYYADAIDFPKHSRWVNFLWEYTRDTRRAPRDRQLWNDNYGDVRMGPDKMGPDKSWIINPIHSMRNPPLVYSPDACVEQADVTVAAERRMIGQVLRQTK